MSVNSLNTFLNIRDAHLRVVSGNVHATAMNIGGINVDVAHGLQSVTNQGNVTSNTLEFSNATTAFVTTANATVGRDLTVTGNVLVSSNLTVTGNVTVSDDLTVTENLLVSNNLTVTKDVTLSSNINVVGNVTAGFLYGDVSNVTNIVSNLHQIVENGNVTSNTVQFSNAKTGFVTTSNVEVGGNLNVSSFIKYDSAWFYASDGDTSGTGTFDDYTGFASWNDLQTGSTHFTTASASTSGGYYTAPVDGIYHFDTSILNYPDARTGISGIYFSVNDSTGGETGINSYGYNRKTNMPGQENMNASATFRLAEGDTVKVYVTNMDCYTQSGHAFFSGYLVTRI